MYNLKKNKPESVLRKIKLDLFSNSNHRRLVIVGSGETGFLALNKFAKIPKLTEPDIGLITNCPVHRTRFGSLLFGMNYYQKLDFEKPVIGDYNRNKLTFEDVIGIDVKSSKLLFHNKAHIEYDYLMLACGREVNPSRIESLITNADLFYNDIYNADSFFAYKKLQSRFPSLYNGMKFNILVMRESSQTNNCVNFALLLRKSFPKSHITVYSEEERLLPAHPVGDKVLKEVLAKSKIEVISNIELTLCQNDDQLSVKINKTLEIGNEFIFFAPPTQSPSFLQEEALLQPDCFDPQTLCNRTHSNIFAAGSFLFPNCSLSAKNNQINTLVHNIRSTMSKDWLNVESKPTQYDNKDNMWLFNDFSRVSVLDKTTGDLKSSFMNQKRAAWRLLNWEMFCYFYLQRRGFGHKRMFNKL
jgi:NADH dehydrogenase FAD-containing subunit